MYTMISKTMYFHIRILYSNFNLKINIIKIYILNVFYNLLALSSFQTVLYHVVVHLYIIKYPLVSPLIMNDASIP